ncbi:MAG: hypothetical protein CL912_32290 [Deltaproteobacteria bacterium]|nr:hypothetical protein [Deltaproteobacteria bacterium]
MRSATFEYPIILVNDTLHLGGDSSQFPVDHIQAVGEAESYDYFNYHDPNDMSFTRIEGIAVAAQDMFSSLAKQTFKGIEMNESLASQYIDYGTGPTNFFVNQDACAINWRDPSIEVIDSLNELMFRIALIFSNTSKYDVMKNPFSEYWTNFYEAWPNNATSGDPGVPIPQSLTMLQTSNITVFQSNYTYLVAALSIMFLGFVVVIPLFCGFWELGRETSLNPLEVAKAFDAAILWEQGSNAPIKELNKKIRNRVVKYGETVEEDPTILGIRDDGLRQRLKGARLKLDSPTRMSQPQPKTVYV